jgi:hypothetical protein
MKGEGEEGEKWNSLGGDEKKTRVILHSKNWRATFNLRENKTLETI